MRIGVKLLSWGAAERACTVALGQHKSTKGYWRRAKARRMLNRPEDAARGLPKLSLPLGYR